MFHCDPGFEDHPRHLNNYFKGLRAAFPRRIIKTIGGRRTLVGGIEWEVRFILRAHVGHQSGCDTDFERAVCGGIPEDADMSDWRVYENRLPKMYLSAADAAVLAKLRVPQKASRVEHGRLRELRQPLLNSKLTIPGRYQGGLLFGQLKPRFDNRIIADCPITFAEGYERVLSETGDATEARTQARRFAKVPTCPSLDFLGFRWAMTLANIRIGFDGETYRDTDGKETNVRRLNAEEIRRIDARVRQLGFLKLEPDKPDKMGMSERAGMSSATSSRKKLEPVMHFWQKPI